MPHYVHDAIRAADNPRPYIRIRWIAVHLQRRGPRERAVRRTAHVDVVIVRVDPGDKHVAGLVDGRRREQVSHSTAGTRRCPVMDERNPGLLHGIDVTRDHVDVIAPDAREVQVATDRIELRLSAGGPGPLARWADALAKSE